ncbi:MAG TPA: hypothetical protein VM577_14160 [Anaerovoracaceae bacterium]|nr:hypothetical protein [Anaerovoracaceae bacterium]
MFVKKSCVDEIASSLEENMSILASEPEQRAKERREKIISCLSIASNVLDQIGLEKEATVVANILRKFADKEFGEVTINDPAMPHSSEEALKNLKENGWVFSISDVKTKDKSDENNTQDEDPNTYSESAKGQSISHERALHELHKHNLGDVENILEFENEHGTGDHAAEDVLAWLGY